MAEKPTEGFDANLNIRAFRKDIDDFAAACRKNREPDASKVIRRMMADYVEGDISYPVVQQEEV